jgi:hypothetical protein
MTISRGSVLVVKNVVLLTPSEILTDVKLSEQYEKQMIQDRVNNSIAPARLRTKAAAFDAYLVTLLTN